MPLPAEQRPFELTLATRGYETDYTGTVPMPVFFRYFELKRWEMMRDPRLGLIEAVHAGHFFVVRKQVVEVLRHVGQGVPLKLRTWFDAVGRISATVHHEALRVSDGALIAQARVMGVWIGPNRRMAKLPMQMRTLAQAQMAAFGADPPKRGVVESVAESTAVGGHATSFFDPPEVVHPERGLDAVPPAAEAEVPADAFRHTVTVPPRELDVFSHVNAATWLTYCDDARLAGARSGALPARVAADGYNVRSAIMYHREGVLGDRLTVHVWPLADAERSLGFVVTRGADREVLCTACVDTAAGAVPISTPAGIG